MKGHARHLSAPAPQRPPARAGVTRLRVRYCECDPMNVAHHGACVAWLEIARTEMLRECGVSYAQLEAAGVFLVVAKLEARYRRPILYDDVVEVRARVSGGGRAKLVHAYEVVVVERHGNAVDDSVPAITATTTLACVDAQGRVHALPEWLAGEV